MSPPVIEAQGVGKRFGSVIALRDVDMAVGAGEVMCLLGDNGAGKSTLIKILSGVHRPSEGRLLVDGRETVFESPRDAVERGIATVYQDLGVIPLMSVTRNFFLGREPTRGAGPFRRLDLAFAHRVVREEMARIGIDLRDPNQAVGTLSGGERQCLAIARAVHFGAKVLILDEPTSALGVHQASIVLRFIARARERGIAIVLITHNVQHALPIGDRFTVLNRGRSLGTFDRREVDRERLTQMMAGGRELATLEAELARPEAG